MKMVSPIETLSLEQYKQHLSDLLICRECSLKNSFLDQIKGLLHANDMVKPEMINEVGEDILAGKKLAFNKKRGARDTISSIYNTVTEYRSTVSKSKCQILLINAPSKTPVPMTNVMLTELQDAERRKQEFDHCLLKMFAELEGHKLEDVEREQVTRVSAHASANVLNSICDFFDEKGQSSCFSLILINGHGIDDGINASLVLEHPTNGVEYMPITTIVQCVSMKWAQYRAETEIPVGVEIVFAQCFGHLFDQSQAGNVKVTPLSTRRYPCTTSTFFFKSIGQDVPISNTNFQHVLNPAGKVSDAKHQELTVWGVNWEPYVTTKALGIQEIQER